MRMARALALVLLVVGSPASAQPPLAWFSFDAPGDPGRDSAGSHHAIQVVNVTQVGGVSGLAGQFSAGWMQLPASPDLALLAGDFTLATFLRSSDLANGHWLTKASVVDHRYGLSNDPTGRAGLLFNGNHTFGLAQSPGSIFDGDWHHVAGVKRGLGAELWLDGVLVDTDTINPAFTDDGAFAVGRDGLCCQSFNGLLDEVKIWDRALSAAELAAEAAPPACDTVWSAVPSGTSLSLREPAYDGSGTYVIVGDPAGTVTSADTLTWTAHPAPTDFRGVVYADGQFVGSGVTGSILTSNDGAGWTSQTSGSVEHLGSIAYANGLFVVVGNFGTILTSPDAVTWTSRASGTGEHLHGVSFDNGRFVATGRNGTILTSTDGTTWSPRPSGTSSELYAATYFGGLHVVVGDLGTVLTSPDALVWTPRASGTTALLHAIAHAGGQLRAVGELGTILVSGDGMAWSAEPAPTDNLLLGVDVLGGQWLVVGHEGTILRRCQTPSPPIAATFFLHGNGAANNPALLYLDTQPPTSQTAKFRDSAALNFAGGNPWRPIGTFSADPSLTAGTLDDLDDLHLWLGLKNSDDQGTRFDVRAEVYRDGDLVANGELHCITGLTRNPNLAQEVAVPLSDAAPTSFDGGTDVLSLKLSARIGTDDAGAFCGGHGAAVGLRVYFDAVSRAARFAAGP
jgi:hypothetical protein